MTARTAMSEILSRAGATSALTAAAIAGPAALPAPAPQAASATPGMKALAVAASKKGSPYEYGAEGPDRFDCSGLTLYSYKRAGKKLPRTVIAQYNKTRHISVSSRALGDLVFFPTGSTIQHVGIYAGNGRIWHSPRPGTKVRLEKIWTRIVRYGRVR